LSSTNDTQPPDLIRTFHREELAPLASRLRAEGRRLFSHGPEETAASYYIERRRTTMKKADFEAFQVNGAEDLAAGLVKLWEEQGRPELAQLAPGLAKIAEAVRLKEEMDDEVSPLLYVMF
jgi:hypothetical protein